SGSLLGISGAAFNNLAGATFDMQHDGPINNTNNAVFNNAGTFIKSAGSGAANVYTAFNNSGLVEIQSGTLRLSGDGSHSGMFQGMAALAFGGGSHILTTTSSVNSVQLQVAAGAVEVSGNFTPAGVILTGGILTIHPGATANTGSYSQSNGILGGAGDFTVAGLLSWSGGIMDGPGTTHANGGMFLTGIAAKTWRNGRVVNNSGLAVWNSGSLLGISGAAFNNLAGATFDMQYDGSINNSNNAIFNNAGTFVKSAGSGAATIYTNFNNSGSLTVQSGLLVFNANFTQTASGVLYVQIAGLADYDQYDINGQASLDGTLDVSLLGGYVPSPGDSFTVMTFNSRAGQFATVNGHGQSYLVNYTATGVTLVAQ
ncbi:MAG: hypothetical protein L0322_07495, partial [Chloroflexi bacterium]|nr:hypothetical protein [Chloroflexota bacterium]